MGLLTWLVLTVRLASGAESLTGDQIIEKLLAHSEAKPHQKELEHYTYKHHLSIDEMDGEGRIKTHRDQDFDVGFVEGKPVHKLVKTAILDKKGTTQKLESDATEKEKSKEKGSTTKRPELQFDGRLADRYEFTNAGTELLDGRKCFKVVFTPRKPEPAAKGPEDKFLNRLAGTIYVDEEEWEVAGVNAELQDEVKFGLGLAANFKKLIFESRRRRLAPGIWIDSTSHSDIEGRKLFGRFRIRSTAHSSDVKPEPASK